MIHSWPVRGEISRQVQRFPYCAGKWARIVFSCGSRPVVRFSLHGAAMKAIALAVLLSLVGFTPNREAPPRLGAGETTLTIRITSAVPGREVPVEGYYVFREGQPHRVEGQTPLRFSASSEYVAALLRNVDAQNRIRVELIRSTPQPDTLLLVASGRVVRLSTGEAGGAPYHINAF